MKTPQDEAFDMALDASLDWIELYKKTDFADFSENEARSFFSNFLQTYTRRITGEWPKSTMPIIDSAAMDTAMGKAADFLCNTGKTDFGFFSVDEAKSFFGGFVDDYTFACLANMDPAAIRSIGVPAHVGS
ncbi:hypothetical protein SRCM100623_00952 [Acetobacter pasteurianus]|uniref:Uncharacterized protein n=2 Tax=Acetobacter pasteurianus TaxID=438 RepID=A0A1A0DAV0_ACEPA|nr:hypothetical protein SRCM100623_00952 [Acetobacter pasteurianus]